MFIFYDCPYILKHIMASKLLLSTYVYRIHATTTIWLRQQ